MTGPSMSSPVGIELPRGLLGELVPARAVATMTWRPAARAPGTVAMFRSLTCSSRPSNVPSRSNANPRMLTLDRA